MQVLIGTLLHSGTGPPTCFSAESKVNIQESSKPVSMRELKTGQNVECLNSGDDFMAPRTTQFCEVMAWVGVTEAAALMPLVPHNDIREDTSNDTCTS